MHAITSPTVAQATPLRNLEQRNCFVSDRDTQEERATLGYGNQQDRQVKMPKLWKAACNAPLLPAAPP